MATNCPAFSGAEIVQCTCHQFFAGATFTRNQNRQIILRQPRHGAVNLLHGGRPADQWQAIIVAGFHRSAAALLRQVNRALHQIGQFAQIKRLGQIVKRTFSAAVMAVPSVFFALITIIGRSGRSFLIRGIRSKAFWSGIITSVTTTSPSPLLTHCHNDEAVPPARTSNPARVRLAKAPCGWRGHHQRQEWFLCSSAI